MNWIVNRLKEPSSWRGAIWLLTALGVSLSPEAWQYLTTAGMALAGLVGVLTADPAHPVILRTIEVPAKPLPTPYRPVGSSLPGIDERMQQSPVSPDAATGALRSHAPDGYNG